MLPVRAGFYRGSSGDETGHQYQRQQKRRQFPFPKSVHMIPSMFNRICIPFSIDNACLYTIAETSPSIMNKL